MAAKGNANVQMHGSPELTSLYQESTAFDAKRWAENLSRFYEVCKKQTSEAELAEARQRGCYRVLPPVVEPPDNDPTISELLQELDESIRKSLTS